MISSSLAISETRCNLVLHQHSCGSRIAGEEREYVGFTPLCVGLCRNRMRCFAAAKSPQPDPLGKPLIKTITAMKFLKQDQIEISLLHSEHWAMCPAIPASDELLVLQL